MPETLDNGIVVAITPATHAGGDAVSLQDLTVVVAGILTASVAMKDQSRLPVWAAQEPSHAQSIDHDLAADLLTQ